MTTNRKATAASPARLVTAILALAAALVTLPAHANGQVNVYSYRQPFLIKPMFDAFTRTTGIDVNVVYAKKGLTERLKQEGANSQADLIFTSTAWRSCVPCAAAERISRIRDGRVGSAPAAQSTPTWWPSPPAGSRITARPRPRTGCAA